MIRNIIWDVDGTLFDTYPAISKAFQSAVIDLGSEVPVDWIMQNARISLGHCVSVLASRCGLNEDDIGQKFDEYYDQVQPEAQPPFPGVTKICYMTRTHGGMNLIVTHRGSEGLAQLLEAHHMGAYFSDAITRNDGYPKKPNPAAFEAIIDRNHLIRAETMAVGDRDIDILAGQSAGIFTCLFDPAVSTSPADLTVTTFAELYAYLASQKAAG